MRYVYDCVSCGVHEEFRFHKDRNDKKCSRCGGVTDRLLSAGNPIFKDKKFKDMSGDSIDFPKDGRPYFDQGLRRTFHNIQEKKKFMDKHKIVSHGSMDKHHSDMPLEAGHERTGCRRII